MTSDSFYVISFILQWSYNSCLYIFDFPIIKLSSLSTNKKKPLTFLHVYPERVALYKNKRVIYSWFYRYFLQATLYSTVSILAAIFDFLQGYVSFPCHIWFLDGPIFSGKIIALKERVIQRSKNVQPAKSLEALQHLYIFLSLAKVSQRKYIIAQATLQRKREISETSILSFSAIRHCV